MAAASGIKERREANGGARPCARRRWKGRHGAGAKEEASGRSDGFGVAQGDSRRVAAQGTARGERGRQRRKIEPRRGEQLEDVGEGFRLGAHRQEEMTSAAILWWEREGRRGSAAGISEGGGESGPTRYPEIWGQGRAAQTGFAVRWQRPSFGQGRRRTRRGWNDSTARCLRTWSSTRRPGVPMAAELRRLGETKQGEEEARGGFYRGGVGASRSVRGSMRAGARPAFTGDVGVFVGGTKQRMARMRWAVEAVDRAVGIEPRARAGTARRGQGGAWRPGARRQGHSLPWR
uniref:Uncharacterized protein n=2 Tax=Oryza sativa subsp. japonica TaxID=39947 RepID=Q2R9W6_ORYSJ|nr:hypothetical protein LOC_Os11g07340 [Oryza sativa Japonica Group]ABA91747.1 hypothetical protein LOC_Os11g07340 [Oryza sativa Japonica Group]